VSSPSQRRHWLRDSTRGFHVCHNAHNTPIYYFCNSRHSRFSMKSNYFRCNTISFESKTQGILLIPLSIIKMYQRSVFLYYLLIFLFCRGEDTSRPGELSRVPKDAESATEVRPKDDSVFCDGHVQLSEQFSNRLSFLCVEPNAPRMRFSASTHFKIQPMMLFVHLLSPNHNILTVIISSV